MELNYDVPLEFRRFTPDDFEDPIELVGCVRKPEDRKKFKAHDERAFEVLKDFPNDYAMRVSMRDEPTPWDEYLEYYEDDLDVNEEESKVIMKIGLYRLFSQVKTPKLNIDECIREEFWDIVGEIDRSYMDVNAIKEKSIICVELLFEADDKIRFDQSRFMQTGFGFISMFAPPFTIAMLQHPNYRNTDWNLRGLDAEQFSQIPLTMVKKLSVEYGSMSLFGFLENFIMAKPAIGKWEFRKINNKDDVWGWMTAKELLEATEDITWSMKKINDTYRRFKIETPLQKWFLEIQHSGITQFDEQQHQYLP
ncbi:hypothetical protein WR25_12167 [Diploscapter pachys]|uniref:Uncharacterized protein n=1 Tax=Diploscapter pachys TaxID=2018661 RepID=A0A2A2KW37_9BILA|nr:hypothetical protein WR25_12167 [Diploscapter pachys]